MKIGIFMDAANNVDVALTEMKAKDLLDKGENGVGNDKFRCIMDFTSSGEISPKRIVFNQEDEFGHPSLRFVPSKIGLSTEEVALELAAVFPDYKVYKDIPVA